MSNVWAQGRYRSVADHIRPVATQLVTSAQTRVNLAGATVYDLGCGIGAVALQCAAAGAAVTGVDFTQELLDQAAIESAGAGLDVRWLLADASATGLPDAGADAVVSSMGIIFVDPVVALPEIGRLLRPGGTFAYSAWSPAGDQPLRRPIAEVVGAPPAGAASPDVWATPDPVAFGEYFTAVEIEEHMYTWQFGSLDEAIAFVTTESPVHVNMLSSLDDDRKQRVVNGFRAAFDDLTLADGSVSFAVPYVVVLATRKG